MNPRKIFKNLIFLKKLEISLLTYGHIFKLGECFAPLLACLRPGALVSKIETAKSLNIRLSSNQFLYQQ